MPSLKTRLAAIAADGRNLSFITLAVVRRPQNLTVPRSNNLIRFEISGSGEIVATDNGDPNEFTVFASNERRAFNGLGLVIVKAKRGQTGKIIVTAKSEGLADGTVTIVVK